MREHDIEFCLLPNVLLKQAASPDERNHKLVKGNVYGFAKADHAALEERYDLIAREAFGMTEIGSATFMPIEDTAMVGSGSCGLPSPFRECRIADLQRPLPLSTASGSAQAICFVATHAVFSPLWVASRT